MNKSEIIGVSCLWGGCIFCIAIFLGVGLAFALGALAVGLLISGIAMCDVVDQQEKSKNGKL